VAFSEEFATSTLEGFVRIRLSISDSQHSVSFFRLFKDGKVSYIRKEIWLHARITKPQRNLFVWQPSRTHPIVPMILPIVHPKHHSSSISTLVIGIGIIAPRSQRIVQHTLSHCSTLLTSQSDTPRARRLRVANELRFHLSWIGQSSRDIPLAIVPY
jgi:hypothetical protein